VDAPGSPIEVEHAWYGAIGDFNEDGHLDIAVLCPLYYSPDGYSYVEGGAAAVAILLGNGDGTFGEPEFFPVGDGSWDSYTVTAVDTNEDNHLDLVVTNPGTGSLDGYYGWSRGVYVLLGDGTGGFSSPEEFFWTTGYEPKIVAPGDFDKDGHIDLAVTCSSEVDILFGDGSGAFPIRGRLNLMFGSGASGIVAADFDGDGYLDLAVSTMGRENVIVLLNDYGERFRLNVGWYELPSASYALVAGDFNGDGVVDLAAISRTTQVANEGSYREMYKAHVSVLLGRGDGSFIGPTHIPTDGRHPRSIVAVDVDGDGDLDLVVANEGSGDLSVLEGDGEGGFGLAPYSLVVITPCIQCLTWVGAGDFDEDGRPDLVVIQAADDLVFILLNRLGSTAEGG